MKINFYLSFLTISGLVFGMPNAIAQTYTPTNGQPLSDNTLNTQVSTNGNNFDITGGLSKGQTLFHSFTDFSIPSGTAANFNPQGHRDIITRVTGISLSDINGTLNSNGANFFLINPNGVVFGPNAQLNVGRAFMASTANGINLVGGGQAITFGTNASGDSLLRVAPNVLFNVSGLNMGGGTGQINNFGTLQTTNPNQYFGLIGGNVAINGGQINAPGGRVELGGLSAPGTVTLGVEANDFRAQFPTNVARGDLSLTNKAKVNVAGAGGGDIAVNARNVEILGGSSLVGGIATGLGTPETVAGNIKVNAAGDVVVVGTNSGIFNNVNLNSTGQGGNINIDAGSVSIRDSARFRSSTFGQGSAGNVKVTAKGAVLLTDTDIISSVEEGGVGKGGNIDINAGSLSIQDSAQLVTIAREADDNQAAGKGNAGNITLKVNGSVDIAGTKNGFASGLRSSVGTGTVGNNAGNITIEAGSVSLKDGAALTSSTFGQGNAGNVQVTAKNAVSIANANIYSRVEAGSFSLRNSAQLLSSTLGQGQGGNISVKSKNAASITSASILSTVEAGGVGNGGSININAGSLSLLQGAELLTITRTASANQTAGTTGALAKQPAGQGNAGNITVKVPGAINIIGDNNELTSGIFSDVELGTVGNGGNITIESASLSLLNGARLSSSTSGQGNAGTIKVNSIDFVNIADKNNNLTGLLVSSRSLTGTAGDIILNSRDILHTSS